MLVRSALSRLAAEVPKQATHDLPQLATRRLTARSRFSLPIRALTHVSQLQTRSYATSKAERESSAPVKKAVKAKAAAGKSVTKTTSTTTTKKKKKAAPKKKKKKAAPKAVKQPKKKKQPTEEQKQIAVIKKLKEIALKEPVDRQKISAYNVFIAEGMKDVKGEVKPALTRIAKAFKDITPAERERLNHLAAEQSEARLVQYKAWVQSHTPDQIRLANNARLLLRKKLAGKYKGAIAHTKAIEDERRAKRPTSAWAFFFAERQSSSDFQGIAMQERSKLIASEWKALSAGEKQRFDDQAAADKQRYARETAERAAA